ncbi:TIGR02757 family protein [Helicobacter canis]|nr:TIGR02757 family protein [Helicobacter canis]
MNHANLQELLDSAYYAHNRIGAISERNLDPLLVVYENSTRENLSAIALVCALFAYGNVGAIVGFLRKLDFSLLGGDSVLGSQGRVGFLAKNGDSKETSANAERYPLFCCGESALITTQGKSQVCPCKAPFLAQKSCREQTELESKNLDSSLSPSLRGDTIAQAFHTNARKLESSIEEMDCLALPSDKARNDDKKVDSRVKAGVLATPQAEVDFSASVGSSVSHNDSKHCLPKTELPRLENILHTTFPYYRFQTSDDVKLLFASLACIIAQGGLESSFSRKAPPLAVISAISQAICSHASRILASPLYAPFFSHDYCARFLASKQFSQGFSFLVGFSPSSPLKRWNMFLRWLTRKDHIDLGLWQDLLSPSDLLLPLDTHTLRISRALTLLQRKSYDRKAVLEVSAALKRFCAHDPIRYDFALYRIGQSGAWLKQLES